MRTTEETQCHNSPQSMKAMELYVCSTVCPFFLPCKGDNRRKLKNSASYVPVMSARALSNSYLLRQWFAHHDVTGDWEVPIIKSIGSCHRQFKSIASAYIALTLSKFFVPQGRMLKLRCFLVQMVRSTFVKKGIPKFYLMTPVMWK